MKPELGHVVEEFYIGRTKVFAMIIAAIKLLRRLKKSWRG